MSADRVQDALSQVRRLQEIVLEKSGFDGYSGKARLLSGAAAMLGAGALASPLVPREPLAHLLGWGIVLGLGLLCNYAALAYWFWRDADVRRNPARLKPAIDAIPALAVGAAFSLAAIFRLQYDLLFGIWMSLYGLAQVAYRRALPRGIYYVGLGYLACGAFCLLSPDISFTNPWPMGLVFLVGEWLGGGILYLHKRRNEQP